MAELQNLVIEVVHAETGELLARAEGDHARRIYGVSGLLQNLELISNANGQQVIQFPVTPGVFVGPGALEHIQRPANNAARGEAKEQALVYLFSREPIGFKDCFGVDLDPPFIQSDVEQVMDYLQFPPGTDYEYYWTFRFQTPEQHRDAVIQSILEQLEIKRDEYEDELTNHTFYGDVYPNPRLFEPNHTLEEIRSQILGPMLENCEGFLHWIEPSADNQELDWIRSLLYRMMDSGRVGSRDVPPSNNDIHVHGREFINALIDGAIGGRRRRRRSTRRLRKRKGTRKVRRN